LRERIQALDGLRFLAALGVLWIHTWTRFSNPRFFIGGVDIANLLAIGGNGVDLFFVISGFCMYYFYASRTQFSYHDFYRFIVKRWVRLSPAFYAATIVYILFKILVFKYNVNIIPDVLTSVFYLNSILFSHNAAAHFWTLGVEFQFYFTIPFLLIYQARSGFIKVFLYLYGAISLLGLVSVFIFQAHSDILTDQLLFRGIEFAFGILSARVLLKKTSDRIRFRVIWVILFFLITYAGRIFISKQVLSLSALYYNLFKLLGFGLMSSGFAGILYLSITSSGWLNKILGNVPFKTMGKISYSFYLWHGLAIEIVTKFTFTFFQSKGIMGPIVSTFIGTIILYPISLLSYNYLEKPFLSIGNLTTK
jgi:peptidoglycan/LPS O-acetylase OafA/YrhL